MMRLSRIAQLVAVPDPEEPKILNLMEALKKSVAEAQLGADEGTKKKMAPSVVKRGAGKKAKKKKSG